MRHGVEKSIRAKNETTFPVLKTFELSLHVRTLCFADNTTKAETVAVRKLMTEYIYLYHYQESFLCGADLEKISRKTAI